MNCQRINAITESCGKNMNFKDDRSLKQSMHWQK